MLIAGGSSHLVYPFRKRNGRWEGLTWEREKGMKTKQTNKKRPARNLPRSRRITSRRIGTMLVLSGTPRLWPMTPGPRILCSEAVLRGHCRMLSSLPGLYLLDARSTPLPVMTIKNVSSHCPQLKSLINSDQQQCWGSQSCYLKTLPWLISLSPPK